MVPEIERLTELREWMRASGVRRLRVGDTEIELADRQPVPESNVAPPEREPPKPRVHPAFRGLRALGEVEG